MALVKSDKLSETIQAYRTRILSVGSGDGSQQASIFRQGPGHTLVTTFFDSEAQVLKKYSQAKENIALLRTGSKVLFGVDATELHTDSHFRNQMYDIILFTFPHTGTPNSNPKSMQDNQQLIEQFLQSAQHLVTDTGEIQITLKTTAPYNAWQFPNFFDNARFQIEEKSSNDGGVMVSPSSRTGTTVFNEALFPGYVHRSTRGQIDGVERVSNGNARVHVFGKKQSAAQTTSDSSSSSSSSSSSTNPLFDVRSRSIVIIVSDFDDEDIARVVMDILSGAASQERLNVLEIRSKFNEALRPDTRQLNRVLYEMAKQSTIIKAAPLAKKPNKPTWQAV